jgi:HD-GYP domain-containing protein (c-di-GMP phosphodiesterase class II)
MAVEWKPIENLKEGEILAEDLYDRTSFNILLSKGTKINGEILSILKSREILWLPIETKETTQMEKIRTSIDFDQEIIKMDEPMAVGLKFSIEEQVYRTFIDSFEKISKDLKIGEKIDSAPIERTVGQLVDEMMTQKEFVVNLFRKHSSGYLYKHGINTAILSLMIGVTLSMSRYHLVPLAQAAVFHDIGLMFLNDPEYVDIGKSSEREKLLQHTAIGYKVLASADFISNEEVLDAVLEHHEKYD